MATPLFSIYPILVVGIIIASIGFLIYLFGFQRAVRYLFLYGLGATILTMVVLPLLFPALNEGMGIGFLIMVIGGPLLALLGLINLIVLISNYFKKNNDNGQSPGVATPSSGKIFPIILVITLVLTALFLWSIWKDG